MPKGRRPLIAGNWKMNGLYGDGLALARDLSGRVSHDGRDDCDILICPPTTLLRDVAAAVFGSGIAVGGQNCHAEDKGPYTGDISAPMLADAGCKYVIVGHSERRLGHGETDGQIRAKAGAAQEAGLCSIICVGESQAQRDADEALEVVAAQVAASMPPGSTPETAVIAYEPIWAIGTGLTPSASQISEVHGHIRSCLAESTSKGKAMRVIYGGSVHPGNAKDILALADVDGALVGGASLKAQDFWAIRQSCPS